MAGLLAAENVAGAAQFEIERRDAKARAEIGELANRRQDAGGRSASVPDLARDQQIGIRPAVRAADAAAQLIKLRKPVIVGPVDDDRVRRGMSMPFSMIVVATRTSYL